jgi:two-component system, chemotaxis family, CheB/CheR fusion protein
MQPIVRPLKHKRVLLVDDDVDSCRMLSVLLERIGYETRCAKDGETALIEASVWHPDVVVLDLRLPWMDGVTVGRCLKESSDRPTPRIVALTGLSDEETRRRTRDAGFDDYLVKGAPLPMLIASLDADADAAA